MTSPQETLRRIADGHRADHLTYLADAVSDFVLDRADRIFIYDIFGNQFVDISAGDGVMVMGHRNDPVTDAVFSHMHHHQHTARSGEHVSRRVTEYAKALSTSFPFAADGQAQQVLFCPSDADARQEAVLLAQAVTGRNTIVYTNRILTDGGPTGPAFVDWTDVAAVMVELVTPDMTPVDAIWIRMFTENAGRNNVMTIVDESRTGYGRTGSLWAHEQWAVVPDITVLGGAGGGGFPFGAVVASPDFFTAHVPAQRVFGASPVVCQAGLTVYDQISGPLLDHVTECGHVFTDAMTSLADQFPEIISGSHGIGLAQGVVCTNEENAIRLYTAAASQGLLARRPVGRVIPVTPPLVIRESEVRQVVDLMASACLDWADPL